MVEQHVDGAVQQGLGGGGGGGGSLGPFQQSIEVHFADGVNEVTGTVSVPAGLTLMIETVTADIGVSGGDQPFLFVETTLRGSFAQHTITLEELPRMSDVFGATHEVRLFADPGSTVTVTVTRFGSSGYPDIPKPQLVTLSGRLIH